MVVVVINGIDVNFPFEPYDEQKLYMKKVLESISEGRVGVLESPTGTGKTLSLLCSTLSWLQYTHSQNEFQQENSQNIDPLSKEDSEFFSNFPPKFLFPRIIYASRTHSQLSKAMSELQKTAFRNFKVTILGSRDQMCIHPTVMKETNLTLKNALCSMHMKAKSCHFGNNVEKFKKDDTLFHEGITDIEDLITKSKKINCCPYYLARELQSKADVIFMPYNYLFDYHIRKALKISLMNAIIILDEAHNIDKVCEEASSVSIKSSDIALALTDVTKEMQAIFDESERGYFLIEREFTNDELCFVKEKLSSLESTIDSLPVNKDNSITKNGMYIFQLLEKAGIDCNTSEELVRIIALIYEYLTNVTDASNRRGGSLKKLADDFSVIYSTVKDPVHSADKDFKVHIEEEVVKTFGNRNPFQKSGTQGKVVNFWCFNPGFCLGNTVREEVKSVILTSGTLAPINSYVKEMSLVNPVTVECSHIVEKNQVLVLKLENGPRNVALKCTFANRQNMDYWQELGLTLQNFFRIIPDGVLLFFPGYATLNIALKMWRESGLWEKLSSLKPLFTEPQNKSELQQICSEYYKAIDNGRGRGAAFIGVCRGKISEGLDFSDEYGRAVIVAGLPYPPLYDPKVKLKKQYIDQNKIAADDMTGETWYLLEATKAVNQAIGRVIRHNKDYGAIILCDAQFNNRNIVQNLSKWVQDRIVKARSFGESVGLLRSFFRKNKSSMIPSPIKLTQNSSLPAVQPSFSQTGASQARSDLKCLESYISRLDSKVDISRPGPSRVSLSDPSENNITKITRGKTLNEQLLILSKVVEHYEETCNIKSVTVSSDRKSCLDSLEAAETLPISSSRNDLDLFNYDSLESEKLLSVLNNVLEDFEEKKKNLPLPPNSVFSIDADDTLANSCEPNEDNDIKSYKNTSRIRSLISRIKKLNQHFTSEGNKRNAPTNNAAVLDISLGGSIKPAKKRKIKLESIKVEDIQLPGTDERSRAREKRLNETKNFLLELKTLLEPNSYYSLVSLIKKFNSEGDFQEVITFLRALLPEDDEDFKAIFKRCYLLFTGDWENEFLNYCKANNL